MAFPYVRACPHSFLTKQGVAPTLCTTRTMLVRARHSRCVQHARKRVWQARRGLGRGSFIDACSFGGPGSAGARERAKVCPVGTPGGPGCRVDRARVGRCWAGFGQVGLVRAAGARCTGVCRGVPGVRGEMGCGSLGRVGTTAGVHLVHPGFAGRAACAPITPARAGGGSNGW